MGLDKEFTMADHMCQSRVLEHQKGKGVVVGSGGLHVRGVEEGR